MEEYQRVLEGQYGGDPVTGSSSKSTDNSNGNSQEKWCIKAKKKIIMTQRKK